LRSTNTTDFGLEQAASSLEISVPTGSSGSQPRPISASVSELGDAAEAKHTNAWETAHLIEVVQTSSEDLRGRVEQIYEETRAAIRSYLLYLGLPEAQAQELVQEIYLRLYQALLRNKRIENTKAWMFRVAHNEGLKMRKREKAFRSIEPDWDRFPHPADSPERMLLNREKVDKLRGALGSLSPQQRSCLYLRAEGLRYREIAETLGVSLSTVNEFLRRALARLTEAVNG